MEKSHFQWTNFWGAGQEKHRINIEFPILKTRPTDPDSIARYERKIKGISNGFVRGLIGDLQPYCSVDPTSTFLWIIHQMNITDKHLELVLAYDTAQFVPNDPERFVRYQREHPDLSAMEIARRLQRDGRFVSHISFRDFGKREIQPVVPGLQQLADHVSQIVEMFEPELGL